MEKWYARSSTRMTRQSSAAQGYRSQSTGAPVRGGRRSAKVVPYADSRDDSDSTPAPPPPHRGRSPFPATGAMIATRSFGPSRTEPGSDVDDDSNDVHTSRPRTRGGRSMPPAPSRARASSDDDGYRGGRRPSIPNGLEMSGRRRDAVPWQGTTYVPEDDSRAQSLVERPYSIVRADGKPGLILYVRAYPRGMMSTFLYRLRVGDSVLMAGPKGLGMHLDDAQGGVVVALMQGTCVSTVFDLLQYVATHAEQRRHRRSVRGISPASTPKPWSREQYTLAEREAYLSSVAVTSRRGVVPVVAAPANATVSTSSGGDATPGAPPPGPSGAVAGDPLQRILDHPYVISSPTVLSDDDTTVTAAGALPATRPGPAGAAGVAGGSDSTRPRAIVVGGVTTTLASDEAAFRAYVRAAGRPGGVAPGADDAPIQPTSPAAAAAPGSPSQRTGARVMLSPLPRGDAPPGGGAGTGHVAVPMPSPVAPMGHTGRWAVATRGAPAHEVAASAPPSDKSVVGVVAADSAGGAVSDGGPHAKVKAKGPPHFRVVLMVVAGEGPAVLACAAAPAVPSCQFVPPPPPTACRARGRHHRSRLAQLSGPELRGH